ncbi:MAG: host attachment protein [Proteobacteria bacterium]|nr:host attachment protein [Pseudomonadota bacterium]
MRTLLIVVADTATARFYRLPTDTRRLALLEVLANPAARHHEHELRSGRQGRRYSRAAGHPQALAGPTPARRVATERYTAQLTRRVAALCAQQRDADLVLVAGGRLLGAIERRLPLPAQHRLIASIPRDLGHLTEAALARELLPLRRARMAVA